MKERIDLGYDDLCTIVRWYLRQRVYATDSPMDTNDPEIVFFVDHLTPEGDSIAVKPRAELLVVAR